MLPKSKRIEEPRYGLIYAPLFVGWVDMEDGGGWAAACSSDSCSECRELLRAAYSRYETVVLPMGERP